MRRERPTLFKGRHFEPEIIILCVRRYLRYALSLRNIEEIMAERNVHVDHVTIWRWIHRYGPELSRRCRPKLRRTNGSWRVDERIFALPASGPIYIEQWIPSATLSIFCSLRNETQMQPNASSKSFANRQTASSTSHQRRRKSILSEGHRRTQADARTRAALPVSTRSLSQQCGGTGPSGNQTPGESQPGLPVFSRGITDAPGY